MCLENFIAIQVMYIAKTFQAFKKKLYCVDYT